MFRRLLLAVAFSAAIHPSAKADLLNFTISPVCYCADPTQQPGDWSISFEAYTYDLFPLNASTGGNPDPATYYSPTQPYDNRFTLGSLQVTHTSVDGQGVSQTTTDNETVTVGYDAPQLGNPGEYILLGGASFSFSNFYTGTMLPGASAAVPTFFPGTYYNDDYSIELTITDLTTAATPEPSSMVLAGSGLLSGLGMVVRRRRTVA